MTITWHYCKGCERDFPLDLPEGLNCHLLLVCPNCGRQHPRKFEDGVAVTCDLPRNGERLYKMEDFKSL